MSRRPSWIGEGGGRDRHDLPVLGVAHPLHAANSTVTAKRRHRFCVMGSDLAAFYTLARGSLCPRYEPPAPQIQVTVGMPSAMEKGAMRSVILILGLSAVVTGCGTWVTDRQINPAPRRFRAGYESVEVFSSAPLRARAHVDVALLKVDQVNAMDDDFGEPMIQRLRERAGAGDATPSSSARRRNVPPRPLQHPAAGR